MSFFLESPMSWDLGMIKGVSFKFFYKLSFNEE